MSTKWFKNKIEFSQYIDYLLNEFSNAEKHSFMNDELLKDILKHRLWDYTDYLKDDSEEPSDSCSTRIGCKYWTLSALKKVFDIDGQKIYDAKNNIYYFNKTGDDKGLIADHIVPREVIANDLIKMKSKHTVSEIYKYLNDYSKCCVITKAQDQKLNDGKVKSCLPGNADTAIGYDDAWQRYKDVGINDVCECTWIKVGNGRKLQSYKLINKKWLSIAK